MRIIIGCEESGTVRDEFAALGHEAWSCDLVPTRKPGRHIVGDILDYLDEGWDMGIFFPPCTHLCVSGARWFETKQVEQRKAIWFFLELANCSIPKVAIENPVGIMSRLWRKPDQIIQPYQFGHPESKRTCLWLKGLPLLRPTNLLLPRYGDWNRGWDNQTPSGQNKLGPSPTRARDRSKTYQGIAEAMAQQWGGKIYV